MANDRVQSALSRIEAAIDRIEAQPRPTVPGPAAADHAVTNLANRHEQLRLQTAAALARLDRLLGSGDEA